MISYLKGKIIYIGTGEVILDVHDVGYKISVSKNLAIKIDEDASFFIHQHIREEANDLYGFLNIEELNLFEKLISVSGVGPKAAMNILGSSKNEQIIQAIESNDVSYFISIPGIGKKVAAKIILDLKSKVSAELSGNIIEESGQLDDITEALIALGYQKSEAQKAVHGMPKDIKDEKAKMRWALKELGKN